MLAGAHTRDAIEAVERDISPLLARHSNEILPRRRALRAASTTSTPGATRSASRPSRRACSTATTPASSAPAPRSTRRRRTGSPPSTSGWRRLGTQFGQNVLADEKSYALILERGRPRRPAGFRSRRRPRRPPRSAATRANTPSRCRAPRSSRFLQFSSRRDLREKVFAAWIARGENGGPTDNRAVVAETRDARATSGRRSWASSVRRLPARRPDGQDAGQGGARAPRRGLGPGAGPRRTARRDELQELVAAEGGNFALAPWDWRYYAEKLRKAAATTSTRPSVKPYLRARQHDRGGLRRRRPAVRADLQAGRALPLYHPDARAWEVQGQGRHMRSACSSATTSPAPPSTPAPG